MLHVTLYAFKFIHCICIGGRGSFFFFFFRRCYVYLYSPSVSHLHSCLCLALAASTSPSPRYHYTLFTHWPFRPCLSSLPSFLKIISHNPLAHPFFIRHVFPHRMEHTQQFNRHPKRARKGLIGSTKIRLSAAVPSHCYILFG